MFGFSEIDCASPFRFRALPFTAVHEVVKRPMRNIGLPLLQARFQIIAVVRGVLLPRPTGATSHVLLE